MVYFKLSKTQRALPAGGCPPLVSTFSFGGDDISAPIWSLKGEGTGASNKQNPAFFCLQLMTTLQSGSSTWLFPEHCLETMRDDIICFPVRELQDVRRALTSVVARD